MRALTAAALGGIAGYALWRLAMPQRLTSFGGPDDQWDRLYHQAYLPGPKKGETPREYVNRAPLWVREVLLPAAAEMDAWPVVEGWAYPAGHPEKRVWKRRRGGVSSILDPSKWFAAWAIPAGRRDLQALARAGRLWVVASIPPAGFAAARVTDHGPSGAGERVLDVSPGFRSVLLPHWPVRYGLYRSETDSKADPREMERVQ